MFIVQPEYCFSDLICDELDLETDGHRKWQTFEFAAAWVNHGGITKIKDSAKRFLAKGGCIRTTVGLDFGSTSYEGLDGLLKLENGSADIRTHVFHDENRNCTFHPKVYLFSNAEQARLIVGSNNMTGAGLETNVEATLGVTGALGDETMRAASQALADWRDEGSVTKPRRLTRELLEQLRNEGYVLTEIEIRARRRSDTKSRSLKRKPLFGRSKTRKKKSVHGKAGGASGGEHTTTAVSGEVLLMRLRKRRNGNQIQMSKIVLNSSFMNGATEVILVDGSHRKIGGNTARGKPENTVRFEAPGLKAMTKPVARFKWVNDGGSGKKATKVLLFEVFDAESSVVGAEIFKKLEEGISTPPVTNLKKLSLKETVISTGEQEHAQWFRLDSV